MADLAEVIEKVRGLPALSIMQPWAWLIAIGVKDIENRSWWTRTRGRVLIHAGKKIDKDAADEVFAGFHPVTGDRLELPEAPNLVTGGIVGSARITDCLERSQSDWFVGPFGFVLRDAERLPFIPCRGALGFFRPEFQPIRPPAPIPLLAWQAKEAGNE